MELFEGQVEDGVLLFSDSFQEKGRIVESFAIVGDGTLAPESASARRQVSRVCLWVSSVLVAVSASVMI